LFGFDEIAVAKDAAECTCGDDLNGIRLVGSCQNIDESDEGIGVDLCRSTSLDSLDFVEKFHHGNAGDAGVEAVGQERFECCEHFGAELFAGCQLVGRVADAAAGTLDVGFEFFQELLDVGGAGDEVRFSGTEKSVAELILNDLDVRGGVVAFGDEFEVVAALASGSVFVGMRERISEITEFAGFLLFVKHLREAVGGHGSGGRRVCRWVLWGGNSSGLSRSRGWGRILRKHSGHAGCKENDHGGREKAATGKASECDHAADVYRHKAHQIRETPRVPGVNGFLLDRKPLSMTG
jgi:hypothetical protein